MRERIVAAALSVVILAGIGWTIYKALSEGFPSAFPRGNMYGFGAAAFLYLLAATDLGASVRKARFLSVQLQCGAVLLFLLSCGSALRHFSLASTVALMLLVIAMWLLGLYSLVGVFRPFRLFDAPPRR